MKWYLMSLALLCALVFVGERATRVTPCGCNSCQCDIAAHCGAKERPHRLALSAHLKCDCEGCEDCTCMLGAGCQEACKCQVCSCCTNGA